MKLIPTLLLSLLCLSLFSQQCASDSLLTYPPGDISYVDPGFINPDLLPCIQGGAYAELVIPYKTYSQGARLLTLPDSTTVPVARIYAVKIENVTGLPSGMCWTTRPGSATVTGDQVGLLIVKGTTSAASAAYPLNATLSIDVQGSGAFTYTGLLPAGYKALLGQPVLKVMDSSNNCPSVN